MLTDIEHIAHKYWIKLVLGLIFLFMFTLSHGANITAGTSNSNWTPTAIGGTSYISSDNISSSSSWDKVYTLTNNITCNDLNLYVHTTINLAGFTLTINGNLTIGNNNVIINVGTGKLSIAGNLSMTNYYTSGLFTSATGIVELAGNFTASNNSAVMAGGTTGFAGTLKFTGATAPTISLSAAPISIATLDWDCNSPVSLPSNFTVQSSINEDCKLLLSKSILNGFSYIVGNGPSAEQYYTISGSRLTNNVSITSPTNYEISTTSGSGYTNSLTLNQSGGVLSLTTIYVRLKSGLSIASYNSENIVHSSTGVINKNVICSGVVTCNLSPPAVTSPVTYCQNATATQLTATGQNLLWIQSGSRSIGRTDWTTSSCSWFGSGSNYTMFTTFIPNVIINSIDVHSGTYCSMNSLAVQIEYYNGSTWVVVGTSNTVSAPGMQYGTVKTAIFSGGITLSNAGNYRLTNTAGSNFDWISPPFVTQTEAYNIISITSVTTSQLFSNIQFEYDNQSSVAPTPITSIVGTTNYYVTQTVSGCTSGPATIEVNVVSGGTGMTTTAASSTPTLCINTTLTNITHTTTGATGIGLPTGLPMGVNAAFASNTITISGAPTNSGTFNYSIPLTGGCGPVYATGTITVNASPAAPSGTGNSRCGTGTVSISATPGSGETIDWYSVATNGTILTGGAGATSFTTPSISTTITYYAEARNTTTGCVSATRTAVVATVNTIPSAPSTTGGLICIGSTATLSASGAGATDKYVWYSVASVGTPLKTSTNNADNTYTTNTLASTTNFWVSILSAAGCESARTQVTATFPANSPDSQTTVGTNTWVGHVYDGLNYSVAYNGNFTNYYGNYTEPETFDQQFVNGTNCFTINSSLGTRQIYTETLSVRYRMNSTTRKGLYVVNLGSDDGSRLAVDGNLIYNYWGYHGWSPNTPTNVLMNLTGNSSLVYDYFENGGNNRITFQGLTLVLANTLSSNTAQTICMGSAGSSISGDVYGSLPSGISLSGTGYQWAYSSSFSGPWTDISGATSATYTPTSAAAPFNSAGTYYIIRKAILSSTNNVSPNPYVATNESNVATILVNGVTGGTIADDQTVCSGGNPVAFTQIVASTGSGALTYRWELSTTNCSTGFTPISGAEATTYDPPTGLAQTTYYHRITISTLNGVACEAASNCITVIISSISASITQVTPNYECPELLAIKGFNPKDDSYDAGATEVVFTVSRVNSTATTWDFDYEIEDATVRSIVPTSPNPESGTISAILTNDYEIHFYISNQPGAELVVKLVITSVSDSNGCSNSTPVEHTITISAMPAVGDFN